MDFRQQLSSSPYEGLCAYWGDQESRWDPEMPVAQLDAYLGYTWLDMGAQSYGAWVRSGWTVFSDSWTFSWSEYRTKILYIPAHDSDTATVMGLQSNNYAKRVQHQKHGTVVRKYGFIRTSRLLRLVEQCITRKGNNGIYCKGYLRFAEKLQLPSSPSGNASA